ncbi:hypothetical protein [Microbacterium lacticum]
MSPARAADCARCGGTGATFVLPTGPVCANCRRYLAYHPAVCPECLEVRPIAYPSLGSYNVLVCAGCAEEPSIFACADCGREDHPYGHTRCARCILAERLSGLLTDPTTGAIRPQLQPLFDAMTSSERPQTAIYWLARPPGIGPALLRQMATGEAAISHETFRDLPADRAHYYLRDLLAAVGVLEPYEPRIERITPWLTEQTAPLTPIHRQMIEQFAHWSVIRRLRHAADRDQLTKGAVQGARYQIKKTIELLAWLEHRDTIIADATQTHIEAYLASTTMSTVTIIAQFTRWLADTGTNTHVNVASLPPSKAAVTMTDDERWRHVRTLLHDDSIRLYVRIGGLFMLLFAQSLTSISRMRADQIDTTNPERVTVIFRHEPVQMPEPLGALLREQLTRRGHASYASRDNGWLFPGGRPGRHLLTENFRGGLVDLGIHPHSARHAALFSLATEVPHMILAQTLGISHTNAITWAALAARDWSGYIPHRADACSSGA